MKLFLFAGEQSGDRHGSALMRTLPSTFDGVGGPLMRKEGLHSILNTEEFEVMGFYEILTSLPKIWKQFYFIRNHILQNQYDGVILIDYPGLNIRMARSLRKKGYKGKIIQYVCPGIWGCRKWHIDSMAKTLDLLLSILPFEKKAFQHTPLPITYVGHPTIAEIKNYKYDNTWKEQVGFAAKRQLIALFPGSRKSELQEGFAKQLKALKKIQPMLPETEIAISCAREDLQKIIEKKLKDIDLKATIVPNEYSYELMRDCHSAIATSGTVTLELALHKTPTVVTYEVSNFNRFVVKVFIRPNLSRFCIVNILGNREIFPELIEEKYDSEKLTNYLFEIHRETPQRRQCLEGCQEITNLLGNTDASEAAADAIQELLR